MRAFGLSGFIFALSLSFIFLTLSAAAESPCEKRFKAEVAKMEQRFANERRLLESEHQKRADAIKNRRDKLRTVYEHALTERYSPNSAQKKKHQTLVDKVGKLDKEISNLTGELKPDMKQSDWDAKQKEINSLQKRRDLAEQNRKKSSLELQAASKPLSQRMAAVSKSFSDLSKSSSQLRALEAIKKENLESLARRKSRELKWLEKLRDHCKRTGDWVANETGPTKERCRCEIKQVLQALVAIIKERARHEATINGLQFDVARQYELAFDEISERNKSLEIDKSTGLRAHAASILIATSGRILDIGIDLDTETVSEFGGALKVGQELTTNAETYLELSGINPEKNKKLPKSYRANWSFYIKVSKLNTARKKRKQLLVRENLAWDQLLKASKCLRDCRITHPRSLRGELQAISADIGGRTKFLSRYRKPYEKALLVTDVRCDLCAALKALIELQAYREHAHRTAAELRLANLVNKRNLRNISAQLFKYLHRDGSLDATWYKVLSTGVSFWGPAGLGVALGEAFVDLCETHGLKLPTQNSLKSNLNQISRYLEQNEISLVYWEAYARRTDRMMNDILNRLFNHCLGKPCPKKLAYSPSTLRQAGLARYSLAGHNRAAGHIFTESLEYTTDEDVTALEAEDLAYIPEESAQQRMIVYKGKIVENTDSGLVRELSGYCLDPASSPPASGPNRYTSIRYPNLQPDDNPYNQELANLERAPGIVERLEYQPTGLPKETEKETILQWYIWSLNGDFGPTEGRKKIEKQVEENGITVPPEAVEKLNDNIWEGIDLTRKAVRREAGGL